MLRKRPHTLFLHPHHFCILFFRNRSVTFTGAFFYLLPLFACLARLFTAHNEQKIYQKCWIQDYLLKKILFQLYQRESGKGTALICKLNKQKAKKNLLSCSCNDLKILGERLIRKNIQSYEKENNDRKDIVKRIEEENSYLFFLCFLILLFLCFFLFFLSKTRRN